RETAIGLWSSTGFSPSSRNGRAPPGRALARAGPLLAVVFFDHGVNLLLHRVQVEGSRVLHRRVVDGRLGKGGHPLLDEDETPELTGVEVVAVAEGARRRGLAGDHRVALERVLAKVHDAGHEIGRAAGR